MTVFDTTMAITPKLQDGFSDGFDNFNFSRSVFIDVLDNDGDLLKTKKLNYPQVTFPPNFSPFYHEVWGHGLEGLHGKSLEEVIGKLNEAILQLGVDRHEDYYKATRGKGAKLEVLLRICERCRCTLKVY